MSQEAEKEQLLDEWRRVYKNHIATFVVWKYPSGKFHYRCVIQHHILEEYSDKALSYEEVEVLFKKRPELQEYF